MNEPEGGTDSHFQLSLYPSPSLSQMGRFLGLGILEVMETLHVQGSFLNSTGQATLAGMDRVLARDTQLWEGILFGAAVKCCQTIFLKVFKSLQWDYRARRSPCQTSDTVGGRRERPRFE